MRMARPRRVKRTKQAKRCHASPSPKVKFATQEEAEMRLIYRQTLHAGEPQKKPQRVYRCPNCKCWHLTSTK